MKNKYTPYQPKTGQRCGCRPGIYRDNCPKCEGTGWEIDFAAIRARKLKPPTPCSTGGCAQTKPEKSLSMKTRNYDTPPGYPPSRLARFKFYHLYHDARRRKDIPRMIQFMAPRWEIMWFWLWFQDQDNPACHQWSITCRSVYEMILQRKGILRPPTPRLSERIMAEADALGVFGPIKPQPVQPLPLP